MKGNFYKKFKIIQSDLLQAHIFLSQRAHYFVFLLPSGLEGSNIGPLSFKSLLIIKLRNYFIGVFLICLIIYTIGYLFYSHIGRIEKYHFNLLKIYRRTIIGIYIVSHAIVFVLIPYDGPTIFGLPKNYFITLVVLAFIILTLFEFLFIPMYFEFEFSRHFRKQHYLVPIICGFGFIFLVYMTGCFFIYLFGVGPYFVKFNKDMVGKYIGCRGQYRGLIKKIKFTIGVYYRSWVPLIYRVGDGVKIKGEHANYYGLQGVYLFDDKAVEIMDNTHPQFGRPHLDEQYMMDFWKEYYKIKFPRSENLIQGFIRDFWEKVAEARWNYY